MVFVLVMTSGEKIKMMVSCLLDLHGKGEIWTVLFIVTSRKKRIKK